MGQSGQQVYGIEALEIAIDQEDQYFKSESSQLSPPASTKEEIHKSIINYIFIRNDSNKEILSKIFISVKKERPEKGRQ